MKKNKQKQSKKQFSKKNKNTTHIHSSFFSNDDDGYRYSPRLSTEEQHYLSQYPHIMDEFTFSEEQLQSLERDGYLLIKHLIPSDICDQLVKELFSEANNLFGIDRDNEGTWSKIPFHGCVNVWHTSTLNNVIRQHPVLYSIFAQLLKTPELTVSVDRFGMKPPCPESEVEEKRHKNENIQLHTDVNYWHTNLNRPQFQAGLCLNDCPSGGGGFFVLPGFHHREEITRYMNDAENGRYGKRGVPKPHQSFVPFRDEISTQQRAIEVPMEKGDFVVWNNLLPHAGGVNQLTDHWRLHTFVRFTSLRGPCCHSRQRQQDHEQYRSEVFQSIDNWKQPKRYATLNPVRSSSREKSSESSLNNKSKPKSQIELTSLGEKILGLEEWTPK
eukprot:gb/GECH01001690.1/.p1 GENE.gb/GECH01001690.1/~~gb/GECH01001690.1/.p1  ORF type:complete len:385 (+),score=97.13 gb/GECH01001690.1/:1-1155(+)